MTTFKKTLIAVLSIALLSQQATGAVLCRWVHDEVRLNAIAESQAPVEREALTVATWKRVFSRESILSFDMAVYKQWQRELLLDQKTAEDVFRSDVFEAKVALLDKVNMLSRERFSAQDMATAIENLGLLKQRTFAKLINKWNLTKGIDQQFISEFSQDIFWSLRGAQSRNLDYLTMKPSTRAKVQQERWLHSQILEKGLIGLVSEMPAATPSLKNGLHSNLKKFWNLSLFRAFALTKLSLPGLNDKQITPELLNKIILHGIEPYRKELESEFHAQSRRNLYEVLRGKIIPVAMVAFAMHLSFSTAQVGEIKHLTLEEKQRIAEIARESGRIVDSGQQALSEVRAESRKIRYERTLQLLAEKWGGRNPTPEELSYLVGKIWQEAATPEVIARMNEMRPDLNTPNDTAFIRDLPGTFEALIADQARNP